MPKTTPRQFRLSDDVIDTLERLKLHLGLTSRAEVIRLLARRAAQEHGLNGKDVNERPQKRLKKNPKKTD